MPTTDELYSMIESLNTVVKAQSNRIDSLNSAISLISDSYFAFAKNAPSIELIAKLRQDDAKVIEALRDRTVAAFSFCNCRIELLDSINMLLIKKIGKLLNEEDKKIFASEIKQKYNEMIAGFLNDDSIPEESKIDLRKIAKSGFPITIVR